MEQVRRSQLVPIVGQNRASLPDGAVDPQHSTDCGEACMTSVLRYFGLGWLPPGCMRVWMKGESGSGETSSFDLVTIGRRVGLESVAEEPTTEELRGVLEAAYASGGLVVVLGAFVSPDTAHWNVAHVTDAEGVWCMDPWYPLRVQRNWVDLASKYRGEVAVFHAR